MVVFKELNQIIPKYNEQFEILYYYADEENLESRKKLFLKKIKGSSNKYKRYDGSTLRYAGGKSRAVGYIVELLPSYVKKVVSPFFGGGSVEIALNKELGMDVIGFDVFDILVNYWEQQIARPKELYNLLKKFKPNKEEFFKVKEKLKKHWKSELLIEDKLELAAMYFFNHQLSYGPGFLSWPSSVYLDSRRYSKLIDKVKNFQLSNLSVNTSSFENVIPNFTDEFLYCDPPYFLGGDSKMFKGIYPQRNFPIHHNNFNHEKLRDLLHSHKGGFILSYNDCTTIREWYKAFKIIEVKWQYTMGQGETRIGANRINGNRNHVKESHELLIVKV